MKDRWRRIGRSFRMLAAAVVVLVGLCPSASAEEAAGVIPVRQEFSTNVSGVEDTFHYVLRPETEGAPMPQGSKDGVYRWDMKGNTEMDLSIPAAADGEYTYTLTQEVSNPQENYKYDRQVYRVTLYVYRDGEDPLSVSVVLENQAGQKASAAEFKNGYEKPDVPAPTTPPGGSGGNVKTGDDNNMGLYLMLMAASAFGLVLLALWVRKEENQREGEQGYEN